MAPRVAPDEPRVTPQRKESQRIFAVAVVALAALVVAWIVFQLFEGPVANAWYTSRQHQLAAHVLAARPGVPKGKAIAILQVPKLGTNVVVVQGDGPTQLRTGPGHRIGTPMPGEVGNSVISGHRSDWGGPFANLRKLSTGDLFVVQVITPDGIEQNGVFTVQSVQKNVGASDTSPFMPSNDRRVTLITGAGDRFSDERLVITAVSGPAGHALSASRNIQATTSGGSLLWNGNIRLALICFGAAAAVALILRRRYRRATVAAIVAPMLALGLLTVLLNVDTALPLVR